MILILILSGIVFVLTLVALSLVYIQMIAEGERDWLMRIDKKIISERMKYLNKYI